MNLYKQRLIWKIILLLAALAIVVSSVLYTDRVVKKIADDERKNVNIWAQAIKKKAALIQYTQNLFEKLSSEEKKKVTLWSKATDILANASLDLNNLNFVFEVIKSNETVPVILTDEKLKIISHINFDSNIVANKNLLQQELNSLVKNTKPIIINIGNKNQNYIFYKDSKLFSELKFTMNDLIKTFINEIVSNSGSVPVILTNSNKNFVVASGNIPDNEISTVEKLSNTLILMQQEHEPITIEINNQLNYVYYKDSKLLRELRYFPYIQFFIIGLFLLTAYSIFSISRKSEQNQVWVGMSKETAHQLGTPISSLMAWLELLKAQQIDESILIEIQKDIDRLEVITERFSKVGSEPILKNENIYQTLHASLDYLSSRISSKVKMEYDIPFDVPNALVALNTPLFGWVLENVIRNAVDAMNAVGKINVELYEEQNQYHIDITDTGKGIAPNKFKTIFKPGFTTKKRGWGLGLSLAKRIVEEYHNGRIFVLKSTPNLGTTFRITLNRTLVAKK